MGQYSKEISLYSHEFGRWVSNSGNGTHTRTCLRDALHKETADCNYTKEVTAPTCTEEGFSTFTCSDCGYSYKDEIVPANGHSYGAPVWYWHGYASAVASFACTDCDYVYETDAAISSEVTEAPTCVEDGVRLYTAKVLFDGNEYTNTKTASENAIGHKYTSYVYNNDATCLADGTETAACDNGCSVPNTRVKENTKLEHSYTGEIRDNGNGTHSIKCVNGCKKYSAAVECTYNSTVTTEPTCTQKGVKTYTCDVCSNTYTEEMSVLGHSFENYTYNNNATCLANGTETAVCVRCTVTDTQAKENTKLEHSYTGEIRDNGNGTHSVKCVNGCGEYSAPVECEISGAVTTEPTCNQKGVKTYTCADCSYTYTEEIAALGHNFVNYISNNDATCLENGTETAICTRCTATDTKTVPDSKLEHSYTGAAVYNEDGTHSFKCINGCNGVSAAENCNYVYDINDASCTENGYIYKECSVCGNNSRIEIAAIGHEFVEYIYNNDATVTSNGTKTATCTRCSETDTIEAEGTMLTLSEPNASSAPQQAPAAGHNYVLVESSPADCENASTEKYECECGSTRITHDNAATGHNFGDTYTYNQETKKHTQLCQNGCGTVQETACSFDDGTIHYDATDLTSDQYIDAYKNGTVYFEYILPCSSKEAIFELNAMGWLQNNPECVYEVAEIKVSVNGVIETWQVLRGSFLIKPNSTNNSTIGASYNTMNVATRILDMKNGTVIQPMFTMWLSGNDVDTTYKGDFGGIPEKIVYGNGYSCPEHDKSEALSFVAPPVVVSAAPSYNVQLKKSTHANNTSIGTYDFSLGNDLAQNKDAGEVTGRMYGFGLTLQLYGKTADKGMMGMEMPDGSPIKFDLKIDSSYSTTDDELVKGYQALLWSGDANEAAENADGRPSMTASNYIVSSAPYNTSKNPDKYNLNSDYNRCKNGGNWSFVADETDPTIIHVTVSDYEVDLQSLPYGNGGDSTTTMSYYNYKTVGSQYWKIQKACISAGEMWVVQPYKNYDVTSEDYGKHIVDYYGSGNVRTTVTDMNLDMKGITGVSTIDEGIGQANITDDMGMFDYVYVRPGYKTTYIRYTQYSNTSHELTTNCANTNADWAISGQKIAIYGVTETSASEGNNAAVAMTNVIKFDDAFFTPESSTVKNTTSNDVYTLNRTVLWGAKPNKKGWDHGSYQPGEDGYDLEMLTYTADDLFWFSSLDSLLEAGFVPVAVAYEAKGLTKSGTFGGYNSISHAVKGSIKQSAAVNEAYMTAVEGYIWMKSDVAQYIADRNNIDIDSITDAQYAEFVKGNLFFTRADNTKLSDFNENLQPDYQYNSAKNANFLNPNIVSKAKYKDYEYAGGLGAPYYIDSCYVIPYQSKVTKSIAQTNNDGTNKKIYDMGQNQRIVDYVINPKIEKVASLGANSNDTLTTTVTITDTLPKGLTYIVGTSVWDKDSTAVYTQVENQQAPGNVSGAQTLTPKITANADGTTTLVWILKDIEFSAGDNVSDLGLIYFSATIGTPGVDETDVKNQQQLTNSVIISSELDICREYLDENGNYSEVSLEVLKQTAISLSKLADSDVADKGQPVGYNITIGNNSAKKISNAIIVDNIPYNGDARGSHFNGEVYVTKFAALTNEPSFYSSFKYYYTTNTDYRDLTGIDYLEAGFTKEMFASSADWHPLEVSSGDQTASLFKNLPAIENQKGENQIVAIVAVGDIVAGKSLKLRVELTAPDTLAKDKLVNTISRDTLISTASTIIVQRNINGHAYVDRNGDTVKDDNEELISDVPVKLLKKNDDGTYSVYKYKNEDGEYVDAVIKTGQTLNLVTGKITDSKDEGSYSFEGVPEGVFSVIFDGGQIIKEIEMPSAKDIRNTETYVADANNMGLTKTSVTTNVTWDDMDDLDGLRAPYGVTLYANGQPVGQEIMSDGINELTYTWDELPLCSEGEIINYEVVVTTLPEKYNAVANGYDIVLLHEPPMYRIPITFFAPDNIGFLLADGITYYTSLQGDDKRVSYNTVFHDSTTIYVTRGTYVSFSSYTFLPSYKDDYASSIKSGSDSLTAAPVIVTPDEDGYFTFRAMESFNIVSLMQVVTDPVTDEQKPWYQFLIDIFKKIGDFFKKIFGK